MQKSATAAAIKLLYPESNGEVIAYTLSGSPGSIIRFLKNHTGLLADTSRTIFIPANVEGNDRRSILQAAEDIPTLEIFPGKLRFTDQFILSFAIDRWEADNGYGL